MQIESYIVPSFNYFKIGERLTADELIILQNRMDELMKTGSRYFIYDLSELNYLTSSGIRIFIKAQKQLQLFDGHIQLISPKNNVKQLLEIAELLELLKVHDDIFQAINELQKNNL
jgi:anti-anti-sigma factor